MRQGAQASVGMRWGRSIEQCAGRLLPPGVGDDGDALAGLGETCEVHRSGLWNETRGCNMNQLDSNYFK